MSPMAIYSVTVVSKLGLLVSTRSRTASGRLSNSWSMLFVAISALFCKRKAIKRMNYTRMAIMIVALIIMTLSRTTLVQKSSKGYS